MKLDQVMWQAICCGGHGEYAEHPTADGGVARLYRAPDGALRCTRFGPDNLAIDKDADGVPTAVPITQAEAEGLLA